MMSPRTFGAVSLRCALLTALAVTASGSAGAAQSLGDLARQEEARRKAVRSSGKVYTNDSIRSEPSQRTSGSPAAQAPGPSGVPAASAASPSGAQGSTSPGTPPSGAAAQDPAAKPAADPARDQAYWKQRIQAARDALSRAQVFADALQSRINGLSADFAARDDPAQRAVIATDRQKALAELDRVKLEIEQHTKAVAAIQEEARRANVPPGWLR